MERANGPPPARERRVGVGGAVTVQTAEKEMPNDQGCSELCPCWGQPFERPRVCPLCCHIFRGNGWDGVDGHYKSKHERDTEKKYKEWWSSICLDHKRQPR